jgi:hypothetical protein
MVMDRKEYMRQYYAANRLTWNRRTPEQRAARNQRRREQYAQSASVRQQAKAQAKDYRERNPLRQRMTHYGLDQDDYELMVDRGCAICHADFEFCPNLKPHIDHDHQTGKVRGVLCQPCNLALGHVRDDPAVVASMLRYLLAATSGSSGAD